MKDPSTFAEQFAERIAAIERRLDAAEGTRTLRSATIDEPGVLQVKTAAGVIVAFIGKLADGMMGFLLRRADGTTAMTLQQNAENPTTQFLALWDRSSNIIAGEDATSGQGLARPYIPITAVSSDILQGNSTAQTTFVDMQLLQHRKQHPRVQVMVLCGTSDGATSGELRLLLNGSPLGAAQTVPLGAFTYFTFDEAAPGAHMASQDLRLQARVTAGTGVLRTVVTRAYGVQS